MKSQNSLPSLATPNATAGLELAGTLAERLQSEIKPANVERPGGTNYLLPQTVPKEIVASILFYAIAAANDGWKGK